MQKIYVLLRQDQQTGPYSLEEIIQFDLKPYDLIWIQGGRAGWYYPQEIGALHPYLRFLPKKPQPVRETSPQTVFVAMPASSQPVEVPPPVSARYVPEEPLIRPQTSSSAATLENAVYAQFRERKAEPAERTGTTSATATQSKKKPVSTVVVGLITVLIVGSVFAASWMLNRQAEEVTETPTDVVADLPAQAEIENAEASQPTVMATKPASAAAAKKPKSRTGLQQTAATTKADVDVSRETAVVTRQSTPEMTNDIPTTTRQDEPPVIISEDSAGEETSETAAPQEKKKKLRDKLFDIFRKKPDEAKQAETQPAENKAGERSASRREESADLAQLVHVRFDVPNEWMMGIHGAKATLVNRGSETVQKATVEVQYFDDDNQLLQKKIISFDKVGGKGSKTISIPDHPTATKVDYSLVSVVGKPAA